MTASRKKIGSQPRSTGSQPRSGSNGVSSSPSNGANGKSVPPVPPRAGIDDQGFYVIPRDLLMQFRMYEAECRALHLQLRVAVQELEALMVQHPEIARAINTKTSLVIEANQSKQVLAATHAELEQMLDVKISDLSIDYDTGRVHKLSDTSGLAMRPPVEATPPKTVKRRRKTT